MISGGHFLAAGAESLWFLSVCQGALIGVGTAAGFGPMVADISHWFKKHRGIAIAAGASGNYLAGVVWPIFLRDSINAEGWRAVYEMIGVITLTTMIPLSFFLLRKAPHLTETDEKVRAAMESPVQNAGLSPAMLQWLLIFAGVACCVAMSMPQVHIVAYCADLWYGVAVGAEMLSLMLAGGVVSRLLSEILADYIGGVWTLMLGSALQCLALFLYIPFDGVSVALYRQPDLRPVPGRHRAELRGDHPRISPRSRGWAADWLGDDGDGNGDGFGRLALRSCVRSDRSYQLAFINGILWNVANMAVIALIMFRSRPGRSAYA